MIFFFTIPAWFILGLFLFCIIGAEMVVSKIIFFVTDHAAIILIVLLVLFIYCITKIKTKNGRQKFLAAGIGMLPMLVYMQHTLPYLAEEAMSGSLVRLLFDLLNWTFMIALLAVAGLWVPAMYAEKTDERAGISAIKYTSLCCALAIGFYLFVICG